MCFKSAMATWSGICLLWCFEEHLVWFLSLRVFRTIIFIFIVISTMFRPICPPAFFRCLLNSGTFTELWTTSFIESTGVACSDSVSRKGRNSKFREGSQVRQTPEEGRRTYRPKHCGNNNKDEDNSLKNP